MKFSLIALVALLSQTEEVNAITIRSTATLNPVKKAKRFMKKCDKNGDGITWNEALACGAPPSWESKFISAAGEGGLNGKITE